MKLGKKKFTEKINYIFLKTYIYHSMDQQRFVLIIFYMYRQKIKHRLN